MTIQLSISSDFVSKGEGGVGQGETGSDRKEGNKKKGKVTKNFPQSCLLLGEFVAKERDSLITYPPSPFPPRSLWAVRACPLTSWASAALQRVCVCVCKREREGDEMVRVKFPSCAEKRVGVFIFPLQALSSERESHTLKE